jgi:iron complex outermembrane receptor protein
MYSSSLRLFTFALASTGLVFSANGGASVSGNIVDPQGRAVTGSSVSLFANNGDAELRTTADSSGSYRFEHLKAGDYLLEAHAAGFSIYRVENVHVDDDSQLKLDLALSIGTVQEQVSVTASSTPQPVDQVSKALTIVDNASIQERQDYSLADAVRLTPGLRVQQLGGPGAFTEIRIRGLRPEDTAVLVDGLRLRDASATQADASSLLEDFVLTDSSRIEILRGSGSSLYGTDAIGGVVNVITDQGGGRNHGSVQLEGGSLGLFRGTALAAGGSKDDRVQYSAGVMHLNVTEGVGGNAPARISSAQGRVSFRLSPGIQLVTRFFGVDSFSKLNTDPQAIADYPTGIVSAIPLLGAGLAAYTAGVPLPTIDTGNATYIPSTNDPDYTRHGRFETGALTLLARPTSKLGYTLDYQIVDSSRTYGNGPAGAGYQPAGNTLSDYNGRIQTINVQGNYVPGTYSLLSAGYEYENENFNSGSSAALSPASNSFVNVTQSSNTAFVQDQARLFGDRLYLSGAFRAQFFSFQQPVFTPAANAPYKGIAFSAPPAAYTGDGSAAYFIKRTQTKIRAHVGRGYRAPSLYERFGAGYDSFFGYSVYGDPTLKPEQSIAIDAGVDQSFLHNKLRISATYFYTQLQRVISFDFSGLINPATDPFGRFMGYLNTNGGFARGVEFNSDWAVTHSLTLSSSYTYTDARERTPLVPRVYQSFITPRNQFTAFAVQRIGQRIFLDFALSASSNYLAQVYSNFSSGAYRFPGLKRADFGASYRIPMSENKAIRIFGRAENAFNQTYYESGFVTAGVTARGGLQFEF